MRQSASTSMVGSTFTLMCCREEVMLLESLMPGIGGGLLHSLVHGATPHRPFFHRLSALVAC
jgi:hypothetical protein